MKLPELESCYYGQFSGKTIFILQVEPYIIVFSKEKTYSISKSDWEKLYYKYKEISRKECLINFFEK